MTKRILGGTDNPRYQSTSSLLTGLRGLRGLSTVSKNWGLKYAEPPSNLLGQPTELVWLKACLLLAININTEMLGLFFFASP